MIQTTPSPPLFPPPPEGSPETRRTAGRQKALAVSAIGLVVVLVATLAGLVLTRDDRAEAQPLALSFSEGQEQTYEIHMTMDAHAASPLFGEQPITMDVTEVIGWNVKSVEEDGTATIEITVSDMRGTLNGTAVPTSPVPSTEVVIAADGRVLSAGGIAFGGAIDTGGYGFPGMGQLTPILPDEGDTVSVGDTWEKDFSQDFPFGEGTIEYTASSTYARDEDVGGRRAAVIETEMTVPLDVTVEFADLIATLGPEVAGATGSGDLGALDGAKIAYGGKGTVSQTSFVDLSAKELLQMHSRGGFDISMGFEGIPGLSDAPVEMNLQGTFTQDLELR